MNKELYRMQMLSGIITEGEYKAKLNEIKNSNKIIKLIQMYVDNYFDGGMSAEAAIRKIDELLQGNLDDYDKSFIAGEEDQY